MEMFFSQQTILQDIEAAFLKDFKAYLRKIEVPEGEYLQRDEDGFYLLLKGSVEVRDETTLLAHLKPGAVFGAWGMWGLHASPLQFLTLDSCVLGTWRSEDIEALMLKHPSEMLRLFKRVFMSTTSRVEQLLSQRVKVESLPKMRSEETISLSYNGEVRVWSKGTMLHSIFPAQIDGKDVLAGLVNGRPTSLNRPLHLSGTVAPVFGDTLEGRLILRTSLDLLALEAAHRIRPDLVLRVGPSIGYAHLIQFDGEALVGDALASFAVEVEREMQKLVAADVSFERNYWSIEDARNVFEKQRWDEATRLLKKSRATSIAMITCGKLHAMEIHPFVGSTASLRKFSLRVIGSELLLYFYDDVDSLPENHEVAPGLLAKQHDRWLEAVGLTSTGAFNDLCIAGEIANIIRVSEGFHEKRISQIADDIVAQPNRVKVICIAGPSSSGKTTFIKRLSTQLQVNGLVPRALSLDDYYVNRELTVRDEFGEYDFEAFEALNIDLLGRQLQALINGETINVARYDFTTGINHPNGGPEMSLGEHDVLLLEGIHALNPRLPVDQDDGVYRIYINPMTSLLLDHVSRVSVSDLRLMRRIVRDRHQRAITAEDNIMRWPSVRRGELKHIFPYQKLADAVFNTSLVYEISVLKVYAERYLLEVSEDSPAHPVAYRLRRLIDRFITIYPDHVPQTSLLREFIGA